MPTNGIILLAKTVNACATDAIGPVLRDDSQGLTPFLWLDAEIPPRAASELCCDQNKQKISQTASKRLAERSAQVGPNKWFPLAGRKTPWQKQAQAAPGVNLTRNTNNSSLDGTWITTGMSQCLDVLLLAKGRARAGL